MQETFSFQLAKFAAALKFDDIPTEVVADTKVRFLDILGVALAATRTDSVRIVADVVRGWGGTAESTVIGFGDRLPAPWAVLPNGVMANSLEFDDTHHPTLIHASAFVIPAVLALGEAAGLTGRELIASAVLGFETAIRIGSVAPGQFHEHGFHTTAIVGTLACALAAGKALHLTTEQLTTALGIAGSQTSGLLQTVVDGTWAKVFHLGWSGHSGIIAARLAQKGFTGPGEILEGGYGVFNSYLGKSDRLLDRLVSGMGVSWQTPTISYKLFPSCYHSHSFMESIAYLKQHDGLRAEDVVEVHCRVAKEQVPLMCEPWNNKLRPRTRHSAYFSLPYCIAVALKYDQVGVDQFQPEVMNDPFVLNLADKVRYSVVPTEGFPEYMPSWVEVRTRDGKSFEHRLRSCRGPYGEAPLTAADLQAKFRLNARPVMSGDRIEQVIHAVEKLEELEDTGKLMKLVTLEQL